jgi:hypothetical protein
VKAGLLERQARPRAADHRPTAEIVDLVAIPRLGVACAPSLRQSSHTKGEIMSRKIKVLGLLAVMFALTAVSASSAMAVEKYFHSDSPSGKTTLMGTQATNHVFTTNAGTITCNTVTLDGMQETNTTMEWTIEATTSACTVFGFVGVTIDTNGCHYLYTTENTTGGSLAAVTVHITCPSGKKIEVTVPGCTTSIGPQTIGGFTIQNTTSGGKKAVSIITNVSGIEYNECGTVRKNATLTGTTTVWGTDTVGGAAVNVWYE